MTADGDGQSCQHLRGVHGRPARRCGGNVLFPAVSSSPSAPAYRAFLFRYYHEAGLADAEFVAVRAIAERIDVAAQVVDELVGICRQGQERLRSRRILLVFPDRITAAAPNARARWPADGARPRARTARLRRSRRMTHLARIR
jgi:hypothetical protein